MLLFILGFTFLLHNFFYFFTDLKRNLITNHIRENQIDSILSKILLFDVFWDYTKEGVKNYKNLIITKERLQGLKGIRDEVNLGINGINKDYPIFNNHSNFTNNFRPLNSSKLKNFMPNNHSQALFSNGSEIISNFSDFNHNIIYKEILILFMPIFFLCVIYLFKVREVNLICIRI